MTNNDQHTIAEGLFIRWVESYGECEAKDIAELCDHDESLVQIVSDKIDRFLAFKGSLEPNDETDDHFVGKVIGQFELVRYISKGSYGVVYEARRTSNHDQRVAIKILLDAANSKNARARFYNECRTLAKLNHTNIVTFIDTGETESGIPYLVMGLIEGEPISSYCNSRSLSTMDRLHLAIGICEQIAHAHTKQILHRDLKPSNILVGSDGTDPKPRVIDFGIAKPLKPLESSDRHITQQNDLVGTVAYMSPEQLRMTDEEPDTRSDIYAIGVVLYELLTGMLPYHGTDEVIGAYELQKRIENNELMPMLASASKVRETLSADQRPTSAAWLCRDATRELEWIVMKCIEADPERRYATCNELTMDLIAYIRQEPLIAGPKTRRYRLRKFIARNKRGTAMAVATAAILVASVLFSHFERAKAVRSERSTEKVAEFQANRLSKLNTASFGHQIKEQLIRHFHELASQSSPDDNSLQLRGDGIESALATVSYPDIAMAVIQECIFNPTIEEIDATFSDDPGMRGRLMGIVATAQEEAGLIEESIEAHREAYEASHMAHGRVDTRTAAALREYGNVLRAAGRIDEALPMVEDALKTHRVLHGSLHFETIVSMNDFAVMLDDSGRFDEAEDLFLDVLEFSTRKFGGIDEQTARIHGNYGGVLVYRGRFEEAEHQQRTALDIFRQIRGDHHLDTILTLNNLGNALFAQERFEEAKEYVLEALNLCRAAVGAQHSVTLLLVSNAAALQSNTGNLDAALELSTEAIEIRESLLGPYHQSTIISMHNHANYLRESGHVDEARVLGESVVERAAVSFGARAYQRGLFMSGLATSMREQKDYEAAEKTYLVAQDILLESFESDDSRVRKNAKQLEELYRLQRVSHQAPPS